MDKSSIIGTAVSVVVTLIVTMAVGSIMGVFEKGSAAMERDAIESIVDERLNSRLKTDTGMTHAEALATINISVARIETKVQGVESDVQDIRNAVRALAQ